MWSRPLFIVGPPRSGSTYLTRLIDGHPDVLLTNETRVLTWAWRATNPDHPRGESPRWAPLHRGDEVLGYVDRLIPTVVETVYRGLGATGWWGDKFPHYADPAEGVLDGIARWWPDAAVIALTRDIGDVAASIRKRNSLDGGPGNDRYHEAEAIAVSHTDAAVSFVDRDDVDGIHLTYDDLVEHPGAICRRVLEWWGPGAWEGLDGWAEEASGRRWSHPTSW